MRAGTELPLEGDTRRGGRLRVACAALALTAIAVCLCGGVTPVEHMDAGWYIMLADGRAGEVISPYTARFLGPLIVRGMLLTGWVTLPTAFGLVALASFLVLSWAVARFHEEQGGRPWLAAVALLTPAALMIFHNGYGPEVSHAAGVAVFFLLLKHRRWACAVALIPVLFFIREATFLLAIVTCLVAWRHGRWRLAAAVAGVTLVAMVVGSRVAAAGRPNMHQVNPLVYMAAKLPFNATKNLFGVALWTNTFEASFGRHPWWSVELPRFLQFGAIRRVGLEDYNAGQPLLTFTSWLTAFGALPTVAWRLRRRRSRDPRSTRDLWLDVAAAYSVLSLLIAPALGAAVARIVGYAWPLFWLATPAVVLKTRRVDRDTGVRLLALHFALAWLPMLPEALSHWPWPAAGAPGLGVAVLLLVTAIGLHVRVWKVLATLPRRAADEDPDAATAADAPRTDNPAPAQVT